MRANLVLITILFSEFLFILQTVFQLLLKLFKRKLIQILYLDVIYFFQITQLKIDNNPFAKGFRDTGAGKREKK